MSFQQFCDEEKIGMDLTGLHRTAVELGYKGRHINSPLEYFLEDNPGAIEALFEWIEENHKFSAWEEDDDGKGFIEKAQELNDLAGENARVAGERFLEHSKQPAFLVMEEGVIRLIRLEEGSGDDEDLVEEYEKQSNALLS